MSRRTNIWPEVRLEDMCVPGGLVRGPFGGSLKKSDFVSSGYQVYEQRHAINGSAAGARYFVTAKKFSDMKRFTVRPGDFIVSCSGTIGRIFQIPEGAPEGIINQALLKITVDPSVVDPRYFLSYFRWDRFQDRILDSTQGGAMQNLVGMPIFKATPITLPPMHEQMRIAEALADSDDNVRALERLIAKKQAIKQGAIQQLLTGRTRLSGFRDAWEHRRVTEMGDVLAGKALNVSGAGALRPYLRTKNVLDGRIDLKDVLWMPMTDAEFERFRIERGDVLLNEGQSLDLVGRCSVYNGEFRAPCAMQNQLLRFRAHAGTSPQFAAHLFRHCQRTGVFAAIATQTTSVAHLGSSRLSNLRLPWPTDPLEQAAVADVLSDMDGEIAALQDRLEKTRAVKQGMMRELLTGRTRLPVAEGVA